MSAKSTRTAFSDPYTPQQEADLAALVAMSDDDIDFMDIPEITHFTGFSRTEGSSAAEPQRRRRKAR